LTGNNVNAVTILNLIIQFHDTAIYSGTHHFISHCCVDSIGKINRCGAGRKIFYISIWCKAVNSVGIQIQITFNGTQKFLIIIHVMLPFQNSTQPCHLLFFSLIFGAVASTALFVTPVSRNTIFCRSMHFIRTNLNFKRLTGRTNQRRMQRLVMIRFRHRNVVLKTSRNRFIHLMNNTKCRVALLIIVHNNTNRK